MICANGRWMQERRWSSKGRMGPESAGLLGVSAVAVIWEAPLPFALGAADLLGGL